MPSADADARGLPAGDSGPLSPGYAGSPAEEATGDAAVVAAMLAAEAALTGAQAQLGLAPASAAAVVAAAAAGHARHDPRDLALRARSGGNPVIPLVADLTAAVAERDPGAAAYVHRGATSQDILDTALMLVARRAVRHTVADLDRAGAALARLAAEHRDTPMAGRTLTQHAVPTTFGLKAAGWRSLVLDARDRLATVAAGLPAQLGGAAGTLAAFDAFGPASGPADAFDPAEPGDASGPAGVSRPADPAAPSDPADAAAPSDPAGLRWPYGPRLVAAFAGRTGLAEPALPWHTLRTPVADLGAALAFACGALGKIGEDVALLSRTEIGEVAEGSGGGSSAMPHKHNPVRATMLAAAARQAPALAGVLLSCLAAQDERPAGAWHAEWQPLREALRLAGGAARDAAELAEGLEVRPRRMRDNLAATGGMIVTERLAARLSGLIGRAEARAVLDEAARRGAAEDIGLAAALAAEPRVAAVLSAENLRELTDPTGYSGSAGFLVDRALTRRPQPQEFRPDPWETA